VRPFVVPLWLSTWEGKIDESYVDPGVDDRFARDVTAYVYWSWSQDYFASRTLPSQSVNATVAVDSFRWTRSRTKVRIGEGPIFDQLDPRIGSRRSVEQEITVQAGPRVSSSMLLLMDRVRDASGIAVVRQDLVRSRTSYQFTRAHSARAIVDIDTARRRVGTSLLYAWEPRPNTAVYAGYNDLRARTTGLDRTVSTGRLSGTWFLKIAYGYRWTGAAATDSHGRRDEAMPQAPDAGPPPAARASSAPAMNLLTPSAAVLSPAQAPV
jgi:hypothetical protein